MIKYLSIISLILLLSSPAFKSLKAEEDNTIDIYVLAGQSNAVGYSYSYGKFSDTYENVMYCGEIERGFRTNEGKVARTNIASFSDFYLETTTGYGATQSYTGPEYGMASIFDSMYSSSKKALIYKYAAGGTSLVDNEKELSSTFGNWCPRSLWEEGYTPDLENCSSTNDATGLLYYALVCGLEHVCEELKMNGYMPKVKGIAWMQGEANLYPDSEIDEYKSVLKSFIVDLRKDIYRITNDEEALVCPFVIGKIATSFGEYGNPSVPHMNRIQEEVAQEMGDRVTTVETSDLIIVDEDGTIKGTDMYHFCFDDIVKLGKRFAEAINDLSSKSVVEVYCDNGIYAIDNKNGVYTISIEGKEHYGLSSIKVNGIEKIDELKDNTLTIAPTEMVTIVNIVYEPIPICTISYDVETNGGGEIRLMPKKVYKGDTLSLEAIILDGYDIQEFTFESTPFIKNESTGLYEVVVNESGKVKLRIIEKENNKNENTFVEHEEQKNGCKSTISIGYLLFTLPIVILCISKKRKATD